MKCFNTKTFTTQAGLSREGKYVHGQILFYFFFKKKSLEVFYLQKLFFNTQKKRCLTNIYLPPPEHLNCKYLFYIESSHGSGLNTTRTNPL